MTAVLELDNAVKTYAGAPPVRAVDGVSLSVVAGELFAIVGPSGSGKSTLLNLAGALERPTSGTVRIRGTDVSTLGDARLSALRGHHIGFVFQHFALLPGLTALANVAAGLVYRGFTTTQRRVRAADALDRVGLGDRAHHLPGQLSGGEQQRVAVARALAGGPSIILADEPTGNLDSATSTELARLLRALHADGATIGVVTHDERLAADLGRIVTLRDGRIESDTTTGVGDG